MISRRTFLQSSLIVIGGVARWRSPAPLPYQVMVPDFMVDILTSNALEHLNQTIPSVFQQYAEWFPLLPVPSLFCVVNTFSETIQAHGEVLIAEEVLGKEALTLLDVQDLLLRKRFGSVSTPHRGADPANFGQLIYLKQHPNNGYFTPGLLLLEEMLHAQQDISIMKAIIKQDNLDPTNCIHAELKGISELGVHYLLDVDLAEPDYVFVDEQGQSHTAPSIMKQIANRVHTDVPTLSRALLYDTEGYLNLDALALKEAGLHLWQMVTTWRHQRDAEGKSIGLGPAFIPYNAE